MDSKGKTHTLSGDEKVIEIDTELNLGEPKTLALDLSEKFENTKITEEKIRQYANAYIRSNKVAEISQNIEVSFVQLWQSKEYETLALLERIKLCDIVTIEYPALGVSAKAKVIKTEYDSLKERYIKITLGEAKSNFSSTLNKISSDVKAMPSIIQSAVSHATELITGGLGGYVVMTPDNDGYPQEILIMDSPDKETAVNVWRFNQGGLGHSHTGYNGPFNDIALTKDGQINASMITAGILNADLIKAGTIQDTSGNVTINMNTGTINMKFTNGGGIKLQSTGFSMYDSNGRTITSMYVSEDSSGEMRRGVIEGDIINLVNENGNSAGSFFVTNNGDSSLFTTHLTVESEGIFLNNKLYTPETITIGGTTYHVLGTTL